MMHGEGILVLQVLIQILQVEIFHMTLINIFNFLRNNHLLSVMEMVHDTMPLSLRRVVSLVYVLIMVLVVVLPMIVL